MHVLVFVEPELAERATAWSIAVQRKSACHRDDLGHDRRHGDRETWLGHGSSRTLRGDLERRDFDGSTIASERSAEFERDGAAGEAEHAGEPVDRDAVTELKERALLFRAHEFEPQVAARRIFGELVRGESGGEAQNVGEVHRRFRVERGRKLELVGLLALGANAERRRSTLHLQLSVGSEDVHVMGLHRGRGIEQNQRT